MSALGMKRAGHDIDPLTAFCVICGQSAERALDESLPCYRADNIVAVSHIIAERRFGGVFGQAERIARLLRARLHRPLTESEEAAALRWARGETANLMLRDYAFGRKEREEMNRA